MTTKLLSILLVIASFTAYAQKFVIGNVSASGNKLPNVTVVNINTDQKTTTDNDGNFIIEAKTSDEIRFSRQGYERTMIKISKDNFLKNLQIELELSPHLIQEVKIAFVPSGNLNKDVSALEKPRVTEINRSLSAYMRRPSTEVQPKLTTPSAFAPRDLQAGQVDLLKVTSAVSGIFGRVKNGPSTTANYAETQQFYQRIKREIDMKFYTSKGWTEEEINRFLIYADSNYNLAKKYRKSFNVGAITSEMKTAYSEYIKTHKIPL